jgi:hypothetical protein
MPCCVFAVAISNIRAQSTREARATPPVNAWTRNKKVKPARCVAEVENHGNNENNMKIVVVPQRSPVLCCAPANIGINTYGMACSTEYAFLSPFPLLGDIVLTSIPEALADAVNSGDFIPDQTRHGFLHTVSTLGNLDSVISDG